MSTAILAELLRLTGLQNEPIIVRIISEGLDETLMERFAVSDIKRGT